MNGHPSLWRRVLLALAAFIFLLLVLPYFITPASRQPVIGYQQMLSPASKILLIDGMSIHIQDYAPAGSLKDTLVLVHGLGGSTYSWRDNIEPFTNAGYRVVAVDLKGFGLSTKDKASSYSHTTQAGILSAVASALGIGKAIFIGHSMGASVILHLANTSSYLVKGMVLVDGAASFKKQFPITHLLSFDPTRRAFQDFISHYLTSDRLAGILKSAYYQPDKLSDTDVANYFSRVVYGSWLDGLTAMTRDSSENVINFTLKKDIRTLVIWGDRDTWVGRNVAEDIANFTGGDLKVIEDAGHLSMEEAPDVFNQMVLAFLSQA
jgi:pimeloyl-ACP methyl ester carboxylesterase